MLRYRFKVPRDKYDPNGPVTFKDFGLQWETFKQFTLRYMRIYVFMNLWLVDMNKKNIYRFLYDLLTPHWGLNLDGLFSEK